MYSQVTWRMPFLYPVAQALRRRVEDNFKERRCAIKGLTNSDCSFSEQGGLIRHSQLCTHLKTWGYTLGFDRTSRVFQFAAHVLGPVINDMLLPLVYGGTVCIPSEDERIK